MDRGFEEVCYKGKEIKGSREGVVCFPKVRETPACQLMGMIQWMMGFGGGGVYRRQSLGLRRAFVILILLV